MSILPSLVLLLGVVGARAPRRRGRARSPVPRRRASSRRPRRGSSSRGAGAGTRSRRRRLVDARGWLALRAARTRLARRGAVAGGAPRPLALGLRRGLGARPAPAAPPRRGIRGAADPPEARRRRPGRRRGPRRLRSSSSAPLALHYAAHPERALARTRELSARAGRSAGLFPALVAERRRLREALHGRGRPERAARRPGAAGPSRRGRRASRSSAAADGVPPPGAARLLAVIAGPLPRRRASSRVEDIRERLPRRPRRAVPHRPGRPRRGAPRRDPRPVAAALRDDRRSPSSSSRPRSSTSPGSSAGSPRPVSTAPSAARSATSPTPSSAEIAARGPADVLLAPAAARNAFVVDALLQDPRSAGAGDPAGVGARRASVRPLPRRPLRGRGDGGALVDAPRPRGGRRSPRGASFPASPGWTLWRVPAGAGGGARRGRSSSGSRWFPLPGAGSFLVPEEGLYTFASRGGVEVRLDGGVVFGASRPAGALTARLARGRHELSVRALVAGRGPARHRSRTGSSSRRPLTATPRARGGASRGRGAALRAARRAPSRGRRRAAPAAPSRRPSGRRRGGRSRPRRRG